MQKFTLKLACGGPKDGANGFGAVSEGKGPEGDRAFVGGAVGRELLLLELHLFLAFAVLLLQHFEGGVPEGTLLARLRPLSRREVVIETVVVGPESAKLQVFIVEGGGFVVCGCGVRGEEYGKRS